MDESWLVVGDPGHANFDGRLTVYEWDYNHSFYNQSSPWTFTAADAGVEGAAGMFGASLSVLECYVLYVIMDRTGDIALRS